MCGSPRKPKPPKFSVLPKPPAPAETASGPTRSTSEVQRDREGRARQTLSRFDLTLPAAFRIPK